MGTMQGIKQASSNKDLPLVGFFGVFGLCIAALLVSHYFLKKNYDKVRALEEKNKSIYGSFAPPATDNIAINTPLIVEDSDNDSGSDSEEDSETVVNVEENHDEHSYRKPGH